MADLDLRTTLVHEIGHALGLGHAGNYNTSTQARTSAYDSTQLSIMSYNIYKPFGYGSEHSPVAPQMGDIEAIQELYGASETNPGHDVYDFSNNPGNFPETKGISDFARYARNVSLTIRDTGGVDTIDASAFDIDQTVNLRGGTYSDIGGVKPISQLMPIPSLKMPGAVTARTSSGAMTA